MNSLKKFGILYGHYGSGKTTIALNMAIKLAKSGKSVTLVDLDIVNPYFRSSDYKDRLESYGIRVITPTFAGTTLDLPALPAEIYSVTSGNIDHVVFDIGGDAAGAAAFGRFSEMITETGDFQAFYVINRYRGFIAQPENALQILREIETMSRVNATHVINNSHLGSTTTAQDVEAAFAYADAFAGLSGLPLFCNVVSCELYPQLLKIREDLFAVDPFVNPPWGIDL